MPRLQVRVSEGLYERLGGEAQRAGVSVSEAVRRRLEGPGESVTDWGGAIEDLDRRVERLEELAQR